MADDNEKAAFVVTDMATGHQYEIFASGHTRGFEHLTQGVVFNRIPVLIAEAVAEALKDRGPLNRASVYDGIGILKESA